MFVTNQGLSSNIQAFRQNLEQLDLEPIAYKLMHSSASKAWTQEETKQAIAEYLQFLSLIHLYPNLPLVPTQVIDEVWHHHILDTRKYVRDCQMLFGHFVHHFPYFGLRGEADRQNWQMACQQTQELFQKHFGKDAVLTQEFPKSADCQPLGYLN